VTRQTSTVQIQAMRPSSTRVIVALGSDDSVAGHRDMGRSDQVSLPPPVVQNSANCGNTLVVLGGRPASVVTMGLKALAACGQALTT
jgi:hypothetical protein